MKQTLAALFIVAALYPTTTLATSVSAAELLEFCSSEDELQQGMCLGVIMGVRDTIDTAQDWGSVRRIICIPDKVSTNQLRRSVVRGLEEQPDKLPEDAAGLVWGIFHDGFPCSS